MPLESPIQNNQEQQTPQPEATTNNLSPEELDAKYLIPEAQQETILPYKTPIDTSLFNNSLFRKVMLGEAIDKEDMPISGEQAQKWAQPAIQEMARLQRDNNLDPRTKMHAMAQLQDYLGALQMNSTNTAFVERARDNYLNQ